MPGHARKDIVREGVVGIYHTWSRCVQKAFLSGFDPRTQTDFSYRREWISLLLKYLASVFAVDVGNYSVLSNHQHLIARTRPDISAKWSDEEVAWRWKLAWPNWRDGKWTRTPTDQELQELLADQAKIPKLRENLASLSWFMARWKEPIARMANAEMECRGHFYEQRFGSREVLDDAGNLCTNIYVDLNQIKAGMAGSLEACDNSAIRDRLRAWRQEQVKEAVEAFQTDGTHGFSLESGDAEQLIADCYLAPIGDVGPTMPQPATIRLRSTDIPSATAELASPPQPSTTESQDTQTAQCDDSEPLRENSQGATVQVVGNAIDSSTNSSPASEASAATIPTDAVLSVSTATTTTSPDLATVAASDSTESAEPPSATATAATARRSLRRGRPPSPKPTPTFKMHERLQFGRRSRPSDSVYLAIPRQQYLAVVLWTAEQFLAKRSDAPSSKPPAPPPETVSEFLMKTGIAPKQWCLVIDKLERLFHRAIGHPDKMAEPMRRNNRRWIQGIRASREVFT